MKDSIQAPGGRWEVSVDTGGTFTDCLGRDESGRQERIKVLSSSALRGRIARRKGGPRRCDGLGGGQRKERGQEDACRLRIEVTWTGPDDLVRGFCFRLLGREHPERHVVAYRAAEHWIELDAPLEGEIAPGAPFELLSPEPAPLLAAHLVTGTPAGAALPPVTMRLATTRGTNALLTRSGSPPVLFITRGFGDLLEIGTQARPELFALRVVRPRPLYSVVVEVDGRLAADGTEISPLDLDEVAASCARLVHGGQRVAAVALLHADKNPVHEQLVAECLRRSGFEHVSCSAELAPFIKILPRAETTVVDAYLAPVIGSYLRRIRAALAGEGLFVMTSAGGLVGAGSYRAKDSLLSGPAGGIAGAALAGRNAGFTRLIAFDMGGTSTDVARYDGDFEYAFEHTVGDAHLVAPALAIESVAAGGGSICAYDGIRLSVGPESAGAFPGPACYGASGPLTLTDVNLLLGRIDPNRFEIPIIPRAAQTALDEVCKALAKDQPNPGVNQGQARNAQYRRQAPNSCAGPGRSRGEQAPDTEKRAGREQLLEGFLEIANQRMAAAIRRVSLRLGYDPRDYALVAFGGAGPQHALAVAGQLGAGTVLIPPDPGLLSAEGLSAAVVERFAERQLLLSLSEAGPNLARHLDELGREAVASVTREIKAQGLPGATAGEPAEKAGSTAEVIVRRRIASLRFAGQEATLEVDVDPEAVSGSGASGAGRSRKASEGRCREAFEERCREAFEGRYREVFGHLPEGRAIELVSLRVVASTRGRDAARPGAPAPAHEPDPDSTARVYFAGRWREVPVYEREHIRPGARLSGPCLIFERYSAVVIEPGWRVEVDDMGTLVARLVEEEARTPVAQSAETHASRIPAAHTPQGRPEAVCLELFTHRFETIAREMGESLRRTAVSTNVKERLDFSCALLDASGDLIVNAPHIPVHLGSLGLCVREVAKMLPLQPGDTVVTNHPAFGGSHLPDVTLISPVQGQGRELLGYVACRAHHAEIGGILPGSMPPNAHRLIEEGVVIPPTYLVRDGIARWDRISEMLARAPYPSRALADNLADLRAGLAANSSGVEAFRRMVVEQGGEVVAHYMNALKDRAEAKIRQALDRIPGGRREAREVLDDGSILRVRIEIGGDRALLDFSGTSGVHPGNLNATPAVVRSAVLYVLRLLLDEPLPLNEGLMRAVQLRIPRGMLNPPFPEDPSKAPAVVGGNVETSQRLVNALVRAFGLAASSQGTMNNVAFGNAAASYYETVCGGCGAGPGFHGASAVHSHMTNTRITDVELIEHRYPVRVERFAVRRGSGGAGRFRGGDGVVREICFLAPFSLSILSQHRSDGPSGMAGGEPGRPGSQRITRATGEKLVLAAIDTCRVNPGDRLVLETPGGGGYGPANR